MKLSIRAQQFVDRLPWRLARGLRRRFPPTSAWCAVINVDPAVLLIPEDFYDEAELWEAFFQHLRRRRVYFLGWVRWGLESDPAEYALRVQRVLERHRARYPLHDFVFLANNQAQLEIFAHAGAEAVFVNQNALVDERLFQVLPATEKTYDAIYNAAMLPYKRHELAERLRSLALITYFKGDYANYLDEIATKLAHAHWLNFDSRKPDAGTFNMIPQSELARHLNSARAGLCLSENEGAMFAAVEYLLSGLPVLSTPSIGGRDVLFDPAYVEIVPPDPDAVVVGLERLLARAPDPNEIRDRTLAKMREHRVRLVDLVVRIGEREGVRVGFEETYARLFPSTIFKVRELHRVATQLARP